MSEAQLATILAADVVGYSRLTRLAPGGMTGSAAGGARQPPRPEHRHPLRHGRPAAWHLFRGGMRAVDHCDTGNFGYGR